MVSMLMRLMMGCVQMLATPGKVAAASSSPMSFSRVMPGRHCARGLSATTVSVMLRGAGSVDVSARAILATTMRHLRHLLDRLVLQARDGQCLGQRDGGVGDGHEHEVALVRAAA